MPPLLSSPHNAAAAKKEQEKKAKLPPLPRQSGILKRIRYWAREQWMTLRLHLSPFDNCMSSNGEPVCYIDMEGVDGPYQGEAGEDFYCQGELEGLEALTEQEEEEETNQWIAARVQLAHEGIMTSPEKL